MRIEKVETVRKVGKPVHAPNVEPTPTKEPAKEPVPVRQK